LLRSYKLRFSFVHIARQHLENQAAAIES
jgi:hypothetical protein